LDGDRIAVSNIAAVFVLLELHFTFEDFFLLADFSSLESFVRRPVLQRGCFGLVVEVILSCLLYHNNNMA